MKGSERFFWGRGRGKDLKAPVTKVGCMGVIVAIVMIGIGGLLNELGAREGIWVGLAGFSICLAGALIDATYFHYQRRRKNQK